MLLLKIKKEKKSWLCIYACVELGLCEKQPEVIISYCVAATYFIYDVFFVHCISTLGGFLFNFFHRSVVIMNQVPSYDPYLMMAYTTNQNKIY